MVFLKCRLNAEPPSPVLVNIHSFQYLPVNHDPMLQRRRLYDVPHTHDIGLPPRFWFNVGPALHPIAVLMPVNRLRCWLNTTPTLVKRIMLLGSTAVLLCG